MMEWNEYVNYILSNGSDMSNMVISLDNGEHEANIPALIRASILMLDKMLDKQGQRNMFVFPEKVQSIFIFTLMKLFHNISVGKIKGNYDPNSFAIGEKIRVGKAIAQYLGMEEVNGKTRMMIKLGDVDVYHAPIEHFPIFQKIDTKKGLSKDVLFEAERKKALATLSLDACTEEKIKYVSAVKTHMKSSIFVMTPVTPVKERIADCTIDKQRITDIFYIAQADPEGKIKNLSPGQMTGTPAVVFASDLYAIRSAAERGYPMQSIIIDGSHSGVLLGQLDALDDLLKLNIPILCITDMANSFDLEEIVKRRFNVWRWDNDSLTEQLYDAANFSADKKTKNCAKQKVDYLVSDGGDISASMKSLSAHRKETESQSPQMMKLFEKLNRLTFDALRTTTPFSDIDLCMAKDTLSDCMDILCKEADYLDRTSIKDYENVISSLGRVYSSGYSFGKEKSLREYLAVQSGKKILLVVQEKAAKDMILEYWTYWCPENKNEITVVYPSEYYSWPAGEADITIVCGWLSKTIMRKVIFGFVTSSYVILLYDYEKRWKSFESHRWKEALSNKDNKRIIEKSFSTDSALISTERFDKILADEPFETNDELGEIELILKENKFRQYINGSNHIGNDTVPAIPVNFVGGYISFYRTGHKVISATKIIMEEDDKISSLLPTELKAGDFIVVRETDRDIVREIADVALVNSGKSNLREIASKWREAIKIELLFCTEDEFCQKMKDKGCKKGTATIKKWISDEDMIAPNGKDDIKAIADVTENEMLKEKLDEIYDAAQEVRNAHVLAGRKLSELLRTHIVDELKKNIDIDPFNFWNPIDLEIDGIGNVKILKIIDVGTELQIDAANTNRLIEE